MKFVLSLATPIIASVLLRGDAMYDIGPSETPNQVPTEGGYSESQILSESETSESSSDRVEAAGFVISKYDSLIKKHSDRQGLDWRLIAAMVWRESSFNPNATSRSKAGGLMQIMPETAKELKLSEIYDPDSNVRAGVEYFKRQNEIFREEEGIELVRFALASYHSGYGRVLDAQEIARHLGLPANKWNSLKETLPMLRREYSRLHHEIWGRPRPRHGFYRGAKRTIAYVESVEEKYREYKKLAPMSVGDRELAVIYRPLKEKLY